MRVLFDFFINIARWACIFAVTAKEESKTGILTQIQEEDYSFLKAESCH